MVLNGTGLAVVHLKQQKTQRYIVSPGYPIAYSSSLNCVYNITTNSEVLITRFDDFELENGNIL
ncbi:hypothetical protein NQ314_016755 [Rhamnusium bicolor]|uniref:CUB domain-containing protein n=1 Tax=Rhamnusium bicolor TaxID=1586634 RepID=A0AAV8WUJ7_9CUCU|nr:hypothetical protein NQ314_016755 [Rhamnusium bicolor]